MKSEPGAFVREELRAALGSHLGGGVTVITRRPVEYGGRRADDR